MGLMDLFSGRSGRNAAIWQAGQLQGTQDRALGQIGQGRTDMQNSFGQGQNQLSQIPGLYTSWTQPGGQANMAQADFLGLGGAIGNGRAGEALANFRNSTGYRDLVDQSTDAVTRRASALGGSMNGNTIDAVARLGGQMADQSAGQYLTRLGDLSGRGLTATGQVGQGLTNSAELYGKEGLGLGALSQGGAGIIGNIGSQIGQAGAGGMMAGQNANANTLGALLGLANLGTSAAGGASGSGGIGGLFSGLGSFFSGNNGLTGGPSNIYNQPASSIGGNMFSF